MTAQSLNNNRVAKTAKAPIAGRTYFNTFGEHLNTKHAPSRPDDRHAEDRGRYAPCSEPRRFLLGRLSHPVAHGLGKTGEQHAFDSKNKANGGGEITQFTLLHFTVWVSGVVSFVGAAVGVGVPK